VTLADLELHEGLKLDGDAAELDVIAHGTAGGEVEVVLQTPTRRVAYRARGRVGASQVAPLAAPADGRAAPIDLATFYREHTFHGPLLRGIVRIDGLGENHLSGVVRASAAPGAVDLLAVDSSFQLAVYWAVAQRGRAALPLGLAEYRALAPVAPGAELSCLMTLESSRPSTSPSAQGRLEATSGDDVVGHVDYRDASGRLVAQLRGARIRLIDVARVVATPVAPAMDAARYRPDAFPEYLALKQRLDLAQAMGISNPYFNLHERVVADTTVIDGREMINFSAYNYVGLSGDPEVNAAVTAAVARYGTSVSASRVASGEKPLHRELESEIARFLGTEDALVMVGGHATNVSVIGHLLSHEDLILHDSLAHDSIMGGAKLSGAKRRPFPHNDWQALDKTLGELRPHARRVLIAVEGTYSMDGDIPPLDRFIELKKRHHAMLLVDEAHSLGVLGATGRGVGEHFGVERTDVDIWMGTLSKTLASCGGYVAGSHALMEYLKYTTPGFVYSVGISPANAAAALAALKKLDAHPELVQRVRERAQLFLGLCKERGIDTGMSDGTAVVPCIVGNSWDCLQLAQALGRRAINVQPILYPAVEEHLARLRFFITASHTEQQLRSTVAVLAEELERLNPAYLKPARPAPASRGRAAGTHSQDGAHALSAAPKT
jgi:8-amino-7-oxononanoate synthase